MYLCKSYISGLNGYVFLNVFAVEAYVASWIEISAHGLCNGGRGVEAYVASWIEISCHGYRRIHKKSRLM